MLSAHNIVSIIIQWGIKYLSTSGIEQNVTLQTSFSNKNYIVCVSANTSTKQWNTSYRVNAQVYDKTISGFTVVDDVPDNNLNYIAIGY